MRSNSLNRRNHLLSCPLILVLCLAVPTFGDTYHVSPGGNDSGPGTLGAPWETIGKANATLIAGDTVLIHAGTYSEQIRPANNGASDVSRITYRAYGDGDVVLDDIPNISSYGSTAGAVALNGKSYVTVDGIYVLPGWSPDLNHGTERCMGSMQDADHCIVENCRFEGSTFWGFVMGSWVAEWSIPGNIESQYNIFRNNVMHGITYEDGDGTAETEDLLVLGCNSHHNLVEDNILDQAGHVVMNIFTGSVSRGSPHHNVIRNNIVRNNWHTAMSFYRDQIDRCLLEGNLTEASYLRSSWPNRSDYPGNSIQYAQAKGIVRYNVITKGGRRSDTGPGRPSGGLQMVGKIDANNERYMISLHNRFYNNTIVKNAPVGVGVMFWPHGDPNADVGESRFINNIIYGNNVAFPYCQIMYVRDESWPADGYDDFWWNNMIGEPTGGGDPVPDPNTEILALVYRNPSPTVFSDDRYTPAGALTLVAPNQPEFSDILQVDPCFVDYDAGDYELDVSSALVDAGIPLTNVDASDSGTGTTLKVDDARFFSDGMGVPGVDPDWIAVGTVGNVVQIVSVDYDTATITLAGSIARSLDDPVWLYKLSDGTVVLFGPAPDLGAFEAEYTWATVVACHVFHNNSSWDGNDATANVNDDNAIDTSKSALLPGNTATFANYIPNVKGINGIMVDIQNIGGTVFASDFIIERSGVSDGEVIGNYSAASGPTGVLQRAGAGVSGSTRVHLIFPDSDADNSKWMRITVKANANTGLTSPYVFYFGLAVGETGNSAANTYVNASDRLGCRANPHHFLDLAPVTDEYDFNRDRYVNATDRLIQRAHPAHFLNCLKLITAP